MLESHLLILFVGKTVLFVFNSLFFPIQKQSFCLQHNFARTGSKERNNFLIVELVELFGSFFGLSSGVALSQSNVVVFLDSLKGSIEMSDPVMKTRILEFEAMPTLLSSI